MHWLHRLRVWLLPLTSYRAKQRVESIDRALDPAGNSLK